MRTATAYANRGRRAGSIGLVCGCAIVLVISVSLATTMVTSARRAVEVESLRNSLHDVSMRVKEKERALVEMKTTTEARLRRAEAAAERARVEAKAKDAAAKRAVDAARETVETVETRETVERHREAVEAAIGGKTTDGATEPLAREAEDAFSEKAMRDVADVAKVVKRAIVVKDVEDDEKEGEISKKTEDEDERGGEDASGDIARKKVKVAFKSATHSDPLLKNLAPGAPMSKTTAEFTCNGKENTELWGSVVKDGEINLQQDAGACCNSCAELNVNGANRCSVWVYNPASKACWLKYEEDPVNAKPANEGPNVPWTSGYFDLPKNKLEPKYEPATGKKDLPKCLHTIMTSSGNVYMNWQSRIMYSSYLRHAAEPGSIMKAFTRILHKGHEDELMHEIPTMRFNPVQTKCDGWCDYPVADRSKAVADWILTADSERCSHVVMVETDHIVVKTPSPEILLPQGEAMGFKFGYMNPSQPTLKKLYPEYFKDGQKMPPSGNSPSVVNTVDLRTIAPLWWKFVNETETPEQLRKELGWVRDMYAYDLATLASGVKHTLAESPDSLLLAQPPADHELGNAYILHYTWGPEIYDKDDKFVWKFDKRSYGEGQYGQGPYILQEIPPPPEWDESKGLQLQDFFRPRALTEKRLGLIKMLIDEFNVAVRALPKVPKGYNTIEEARLYV